MAQNIIRTGNYFLVGLGIGSLIGVLYAPLARKKVRELRDRAELGKKIIAQTEVRIAAAIDAGIYTYNREKSKAQTPDFALRRPSLHGLTLDSVFRFI